VKKHIGFLVVSFVTCAAIVGWFLHLQKDNAIVSQIATAAATQIPDATPLSAPSLRESPVAELTPTSLPTQAAALVVPYTMQAPFNKWDSLHEDACEEASLIMVRHFLEGTAIGTPSQADQEITDLVHWEEKNGYGPSITLEQLNHIAHDYLGLTSGKVVAVLSLDQIRHELANGHPIIIGMAGKKLPNPYFSNGGPNYHMLVAKGYDATGIITNEPGTWHGDGYHYDSNVFYDAIHNWNPANILDGQKAYLSFK
jgi:hypothetical protein